MRNNKQNQTLADKCAQEHGFLCASYRGYSDNKLIYAPRCSNSENNPIIPTYIIVCENEADFVQGIEYTDFLEGAKIRDFKKGRSIYKALSIKNPVNDDREEWEERYVVMSIIGPKPDLPKKLLYDYLEVAERMGMKVRIRYGIELDLEDNYIYHIELEL